MAKRTIFGSLFFSALIFALTFFPLQTLADSPAFELAFPGETNIIDYKKYGTFELRGTANYRYVIRDPEGLMLAVGEGIYPANAFVKRTVAYRTYDKNGELAGSHWEFLTDSDYRKAFYKWATANDDDGIKMLFAGNILNNAGLYRHALKAYYAVLLHFPLSVGWSPAGDFYWFTAPVALANIQKILASHPEIEMDLVGAVVDIQPKVPGKITGTKLIKEEYHIKIDPGKWVYKKREAVSVDKTIESWVPNEKARVKYAKHKDGSISFYVDDKPFFIKGAGASQLLSNIKSHGGNAIRTWGHDNPADALKLLDEAHKNGLMVCLGFWVDHERHNFDYNNVELVQKRLKEFTDIIDAVKDHPALLMYGIGNEVNHMAKNPKVYDQINAVARYAHTVDPNHPTATILMGFDKNLAQHLKERCPEVDIIGVNAYGGLEGQIGAADMNGLGKPFMITEWGVNGYWEVALTPWKAPIEQSSGVKAKTFLNRYKAIISSPRSIGSFVFLWGYKQERTHTWFNLFMEGDYPTEMVDAMMFNWTGYYPPTRSPHVKSIKIEGMKNQNAVYVGKGKQYTATLDAMVQNPKYTVIWEVYRESTATETGGDKEMKPEKIPFKSTQKDFSVTFTAPDEPGAYRLFGYIKDSNNQYGYANIPFYVERE